MDDKSIFLNLDEFGAFEICYHSRKPSIYRQNRTLVIGRLITLCTKGIGELVAQPNIKGETKSHRLGGGSGGEACVRGDLL